MTHFLESEPVSWATQVVSQLAYEQIGHSMCDGDCACAQIMNFQSPSLTWIQLFLNAKFTRNRDHH